MAKHKEGKVEDYFVQQVEAHGGLTRKAKWLCRRGCPDRFWAFPNGNHGFAEIKSADGRLEPHQQREIARLRSAGVDVRVISDFGDVDQFINGWTGKP